MPICALSEMNHVRLALVVRIWKMDRSPIVELKPKAQELALVVIQHLIK